MRDETGPGTRVGSTSTLRRWRHSSSNLPFRNTSIESPGQIGSSNVTESRNGGDPQRTVNGAWKLPRNVAAESGRQRSVSYASSGSQAGPFAGRPGMRTIADQGVG